MDKLTKESLNFIEELDIFLKSYADKTSIEDGRQAYEELSQRWGAPFEKMDQVKDFQVPASHAPNAGPISVRLYRPTPAPHLPLLIYTHGGGWMRGSVESYDTKCRLLAKKLGWAVLSVEYSRAPEFKFPTQINQLQTVYEWVQENDSLLGIVPHEITLAGDSGGGNITAGFVCRLKAQGKPMPKAMVLYYPCLDMKVDSPSTSLYGEGYFLTAEKIRYYRDNYLSSPQDQNSPEASPIFCKNFQGFPPTLIVAAGCDPLRSENESFAAQLQDYKVPVSLRVYPGVLHAFTLFYKAFPEAEEALSWSVEKLLTLPPV
jgi:acetyl esterase